MNAALSSLTIGALTLDPEFEPDVTEYEVTTANASNKVTAEAADETASIVIKNGDTTVTNGGNASWGVGENTLTITVTDGNDPQISKVYTVTVTRGD